LSILVDSDILIEVSRGRDETILAVWSELSWSDTRILYSPVTAAELWTGARPAEQQLLAALFQALECVPADYETGRKAGDLMRQYSKSHSLELGDALIAAAALNAGAALWTRNRKHYPMKGLKFFPLISGQTQ
jgi:predicted nucleic acid-binding protein